MNIQFTTRVFKEGRTFVAHALELDVSSCGGTKEKAIINLKEAVRLFLETAEKMNTLDQILAKAAAALPLQPSTLHQHHLMTKASKPAHQPPLSRRPPPRLPTHYH